MTGLPCPACGSTSHHTTDSRPTQGAIRRRRACESCGHRWSTYETNGKPSRKGKPNVGPDDVRRISSLARQGKTQAVVARTVRLSQSTISRHWPRDLLPAQPPTSNHHLAQSPQRATAATIQAQS